MILNVIVFITGLLILGKGVDMQAAEYGNALLFRGGSDPSCTASQFKKLINRGTIRKCRVFQVVGLAICIAAFLFNHHNGEE